MVMQAGVQSDGRPGVAQATEVDLGALGGALWRKKLLIAGLTLLTASIAFAAVNLITPKYKSEARVLIETRENVFFRPDAERAIERGTTVDQEAVTSQVQLILSRDLAREVIRKLKLGELPELDPVLAGPILWRTLLSLTGIVKDPMDMTPEERVFKSYYERLAAFQVEKSRVIAIEFESRDPELAAQVANAVAEGYLVLQQAAKQEQTRAAGQWLSGEIDRLRSNVAQAESKVEQYRAKSNLFIGSNNAMLSTQQLGDFNAQLASARAQKADAEGRAKLIHDALKAGAPIEFSDIVNSELLRRLTEQRVTLRAQLAEQSSKLLEQHPRIKELRAQVADLDRQIRAEADRLAPDARIISAAVVSNTPSWPKKLPTILIATLAILVLSSGFVLSSELLSVLPAQAAAAEAPTGSRARIGAGRRRTWRLPSAPWTMPAMPAFRSMPSKAWRAGLAPPAKGRGASPWSVRCGMRARR
jgi:polysaccharide biosynthesis transport protein